MLSVASAAENTTFPPPGSQRPGRSVRQLRVPACQSCLVPPGGLRVTQGRDIAPAAERLRLAPRDIHGKHSKRGGVQQYPLQREVGDAILEYLQKAGPQTSCRNLFLTLNPPHRAIGGSALWKITSRGMQAIGIRCRRRGPHCLRHACATHMLEQGASLKEIGDLLGHRDFRSTSIYAKVHLQQLRRVADFDMGGLL